MATVSHFSAGFFWKKFGDIWYALVVQDKRFKDKKAAGGMGNEGETALATLIREFRQELGVELVSAIWVHDVLKTNHIRHFFLVTEVNGLPALDEKRILAESKAGKAGDVLEMRWMTMRDFADQIYPEQIPAFAKALAESAKDGRFFNENSQVIGRFEHLM